MRNKKDALKELQNVEKQDPSLVEQFHVYRARHLIEDELNFGNESGGGGGGGGGLEYWQYMNFETNYKALKEATKRSAMLHYEFWGMLMDDSPDLVALNAQGSRINNSIQ